GFDATSRSSEGSVHVTFPIELTEASANVYAERSQKAAFASMKPIFAPSSIAVVGASRTRGQLGTEVLHNLRNTGFRGSLYAVGREAELRIVEKVRAAGIRMVGSNCMGVINTDANVRMHATFSGVYPPSGNVAMSSQSGALGLAILDYARSIGIGFSTFISVG